MLFPTAIERGDEQNAYGGVVPDLLVKQIDDFVARHPGDKTHSGFLSRVVKTELARNKQAS